MRKPLSSEEKQYLIDRYDEEITQMDQGIGELIGLLKETGVYDNSLILITSDHGESFGEHGLMIHSPAIYEELVAIPLIVKYPKGHRKGERVASPISLVDIVPEILSVLGIPLPQGIHGSSLLAETAAHHGGEVQGQKLVTGRTSVWNKITEGPL